MNVELEYILNYLHEKRGFDFSGYNSPVIKRRINQRLIATKSPNFTEYLNCLQRQPQEIDHLVNVLTINVSRFFRKALTFEFIADRILPVIASEKIKMKNKSFRIWSAGCSFGEEPYSVAILINELFTKKNLKINFNIFATDIDKVAIAKAKEAVYPFECIKDIKYSLLRKYFSIDGELYRLKTQIKEMVTFSLYDMFEKRSYVPSNSIFGSFDMVLCRNVLIYYKPGSQDIIFEKLYRSLCKNGYLVLGETEIPTIKYQEHFRKVNEYCHIYQKI